MNDLYTVNKVLEKVPEGDQYRSFWGRHPFFGIFKNYITGRFESYEGWELKESITFELFDRHYSRMVKERATFPDGYTDSDNKSIVNEMVRRLFNYKGIGVNACDGYIIKKDGKTEIGC